MTAHSKPPLPNLHQVIGSIPYRVALAGGWIDQPFVSRHNLSPPGSMVVVGIEPWFRFMDRSGMASGTREIALKRWKGQLPVGEPAARVRELYEAENQGKPEPSGSQDMIGLIYPGINRGFAWLAGRLSRSLLGRHVFGLWGRISPGGF